MGWSRSRTPRTDLPLPRETSQILPRLLFVLGLVFLLLRFVLAGRQGLHPASLWLDDEWVAVLARAAPLSLLLKGDLPVSPGFVLALRAITAVLGQGEWQLQVLPFLAALLAIVLLGRLMLRLTDNHALALAAAAILAANPVLVVYSVRIKQFSFDGVATLLLLALALRCLRSERERSFLWLAGSGVVLMCISQISVLPAAILVNLIGLFLLGEPAGRRPGSRRDLIAAWAGFDVAVAILYFSLIRGRGNPSLFQFWSEGFLPTESLAAAASFIAHQGLRLFTGAFPERLPWLALLIPVGLFNILRRREHPLGLAILALYPTAFLLSALRLYPVGAGRTDLYSYPASILLATAALWTGGRWIRRAAWLAAAAALVFCSPAATGKRPSYPESGSREVVERLNDILRDEDGLIVYPWSNYAVGYYGRWPARFVEVEDSTNGFYVEPQRDRSLVLRETLHGASFQTERSTLSEQLDPFLAGGFPTLVYVAVRGPSQPHAWIVESIFAHGYSLARQELYRGAILMVFERSTGPGLQPPHAPAG